MGLPCRSSSACSSAIPFIHVSWSYASLMNCRAREIAEEA